MGVAEAVSEEPTLDTISMDDLDSRCLMSNPVATLFANAGSVFIRLPLAMGLVVVLVLCLFASGCETGLDHRVRDVEKTQAQRMDLETQRAVGRPGFKHEKEMKELELQILREKIRLLELENQAK